MGLLLTIECLLLPVLVVVVLLVVLSLLFIWSLLQAHTGVGNILLKIQ